MMIRHKPTIIDVAKRAGVSTATVSRVMNGEALVKDETRQMVEDAIAALGYRRNYLARSLVTGKSGVVGVLIPDVTGPLYGQMARGIEDVLIPLGLHSILVSDNRDPQEEERAIGLLLERQIDALIIIGSYISDASLAQLISPDFPLLLLQREQVSLNSPYISLQLDNDQGVNEAMQYLYEMGHRQIAHVGGLRYDGERRRVVYEAFLREWGLEPFTLASDGTEEGGYQAANKLINKKPEVSAVFCINDRTALGLYHRLQERSVRIPEDISVIGFDDLPFAKHLAPPLTTIQQPARLMGQRAAELVLDLQAKSEAPSIQP
ncbi:MAG: LacI family DNA-binding transcriptional regulator [Deinococcales bacterium]